MKRVVAKGEGEERREETDRIGELSGVASRIEGVGLGRGKSA